MTRKQQIARAAMDIISEEGSCKLVMVKIAEKVGVTDAALYKHFKSKNDLLLFMVEEIEHLMLNRIKEYAGQIKDPIEKLKNILAFQFEFIEENRSIPRILFSEALQYEDVRIKSKIKQIVNTFLLSIKNTIISAQDLGVIKPGINAEAASIIFVGLIQSTVILWTLSGHSFSLSERQDMLWKAFSKIVV